MARSVVWPHSQTQSSPPCWAWSELYHNPWANLDQKDTIKTVNKQVLHSFQQERLYLSVGVWRCVSVCASSPRWRSLCWGCRPGVSVYAAAGGEALLKSSSRDREMSGGGPGTAIVLQIRQLTCSPRYLYQRTQMYCTYTGAHTKHTQQYTSGDNKRWHNKGRALDCSPVAASFHCCWWKRGILGRAISIFIYSTYSMLIVHQHARGTKRNQTCTQTNNMSHDARVTVIWRALLSLIIWWNWRAKLHLFNPEWNLLSA